MEGLPLPAHRGLHRLLGGHPPGDRGATTLALMMPFHLQDDAGRSFSISHGHALRSSDDGDITSVLFGVPGEATTVAIILDGHAMAKKGEAGRALGAALTSALLGALIGAAFLAVCIPVVRPTRALLWLGRDVHGDYSRVDLHIHAEWTGKRNLLVGLMCAGLGFIISLVGRTVRRVYCVSPSGSSTVGTVSASSRGSRIVCDSRDRELAIQGTAIAGDLPSASLPEA